MITAYTYKYKGSAVAIADIHKDYGGLPRTALKDRQFLPREIEEKVSQVN